MPRVAKQNPQRCPPFSGPWQNITEYVYLRIFVHTHAYVKALYILQSIVLMILFTYGWNVIVIQTSQWNILVLEILFTAKNLNGLK